MFMDNLEIILVGSIKAESSKHRLHLIGERRDHVPRDEEGGQYRLKFASKTYNKSSNKSLN